MGITGLLPFLEKSSKKIHIRQIRGHTVCIDSYCWLHKGAFGCAEKLARGTETDIHIQYCMKYVNMLLSYDIKPILVFDGRHLPAKLLTEKKRRESRNEAKKRAAELLRVGKVSEARSYLQRCVDITHEMALKLIKECRKRNIDTIVAPYEADGQLAYLNIQNIADYVISEDSDLLVFGCKKVLFKLDLTGNCTLTQADKIYLSMGCSKDKYSFDKFRRMAIISGCDYIDSLPGIGLAKACKFILKTEETDMEKALRKIPSYLNMRNLQVTDEYIDSFLKAEATFKHMVVYDPINRQLTRLSDPIIDGTNIELCCNAGKILDPDIGFQMALGNLDPFTLKKLDDWHPDNRKLNKIDEKNMTKHKSMWQKDFQSQNPLFKIDVKKVPVKSDLMRVTDINRELTVSNLFFIYGDSEDVEPPSKKVCISSIQEPEIENISSPNPFKSNPFKKSLTPPNCTGTFLERLNEVKCEDKPKEILKVKQEDLKLKKLSRFPRTVVDQKSVMLSKFFPAITKPKLNPEPIDETLCLKVEEIMVKQEKKEAAIALAYSSLKTEENSLEGSFVDLTTSYDEFKVKEETIKERKQSRLSIFGFKKKEQLKI